ncbi:MAG: Holliday junction branch migration protein RuvA [Gemmobacter sp.]|nr:Holliday junction branch migration protein RuvA [Gemmobacter sp.]
MIGKISGRIDYRAADHVLIDVRGVGYIVHVSDRTLAALPGVGEACALYTELLVREDLLQLFGFPTLLEKEWHRLLMTVQGVGAKAAMAILGTLGAEGAARAITLGDARAIQVAPGIGPKIAQRVVLELKAKAPGVMAMGGVHCRRGGRCRDAVIEEPVATSPRPPAASGRSTTPAPPAARGASQAMAGCAVGADRTWAMGRSDAAQAVAAVRRRENRRRPIRPRLIRPALKLLAPKT